MISSDLSLPLLLEVTTGMIQTLKTLTESLKTSGLSGKELFEMEEKLHDLRARQDELIRIQAMTDPYEMLLALDRLFSEGPPSQVCREKPTLQ